VILGNKQLKPSVLLVADRTLSADYKILFEGIFATMQTTQVPGVLMRRLLSPRATLEKSGRARSAVLGLRRVEASLLSYTRLGENDVVCTTPEGLPGLIGPWVQVVLFSSSDPLGMGMSNTTTKSFWSGELYTSLWTRELLSRLKESKHRYGFKLIVGGAGAWQFKADPRKRREMGVDVVFEGFFESAGPGLVENLLDGANPDDYIESETCADRIVPIRYASTMGVIELSRGCGRGCRFCTMAKRRMEHVDPDTVISDLCCNRDAGLTSVVSSSEDFFRYGGHGTSVNFESLARLLEEMRRIEGLSFMQIDHGNISSVLQFDDCELKEIRELLRWEKKTDYLWVNMGVESANGELVKANCPGKLKPLNAEDWEEHVRDAADKMFRCGFYPVFSVILGLPGETSGDIKRTRRLVEDLGRNEAVVFPIFYEPVRTDESREEQRFTLDKMSAEHLKLYRACYEINFRLIPRLFWDNQRAGGVSPSKRALLRILGKGEVRSWRKAFKKIARKTGSGF